MGKDFWDEKGAMVIPKWADLSWLWVKNLLISQVGYVVTKDDREKHTDGGGKKKKSCPNWLSAFGDSNAGRISPPEDIFHSSPPGDPKLVSQNLRRERKIKNKQVLIYIYIYIYKVWKVPFGRNFNYTQLSNTRRIMKKRWAIIRLNFGKFNINWEFLLARKRHRFDVFGRKYMKKWTNLKMTRYISVTTHSDSGAKRTKWNRWMDGRVYSGLVYFFKGLPPGKHKGMR